MATVIVPKTFFIKERRMYSNWQFAFWRELFQNATDAACTMIKITCQKNNDGTIVVEFSDNGLGMTKDTLENVYFKLGETTKNGSSSVGGFGRARVLTCFSMKSYEIWTQDSHVTGNGGEYDILPHEYTNGCRLRIEMENESYDSIMDNLNLYLSMSQMHCSVFVNNERWTTWSHRRVLSRELFHDNEAFASVYVNKSGKYNQYVIIRVDGTCMFTANVAANAQVIVEINQSKSRSVLTANRDGLVQKYNDALQAFLSELAVDTRSAIKSRMGRKSAFIKGNGPYVSMGHAVSVVRANSEAVNKIAEGLRAGTIIDAIASASVGLSECHLSKSSLENESVTIPRKVGDPFIENLPDINIIDETENPEVRKVIDMYNPQNWVLASANGKMYRKGGNFYKLLMLWKVACEAAVDALLETHRNMDGLRWSLGWHFSEDTKASCKQNGSCFLFSLNPVDKEGKVAYGLRDKKDQKTLMAYAKHEIAHCLASYHNEEYAAILTDIDINYVEKEVFAKMLEMLGKD